MRKKLKSMCILAALALTVMISSCGKSEVTETTGTKAASESKPQVADKDKPYTEVKASSNSLDPSKPIPEDTGTLELTEQVFSDENLKLKLPTGVTVEHEPISEGAGHITVKDDNGVWKLIFTPYSNNNHISGIDTTVIYDGNPVKTDWSRGVETTLSGMKAKVWANNIRKGWINPSNPTEVQQVDIVMDFGETLVGPWYGLYVRLEPMNPTEDTNIYDILYLRHVRAVLNNFELILTKAGEGITHSAGGITVNIPARWNVKEGENSIVSTVHSDKLFGGITFLTTLGGDPEKHSTTWEGESLKKSYNGVDYYGCIQAIEQGRGTEEPVITYHMDLYSKFSEDRSLQVGVNFRDFTADDLKAFLDNEQFKAMMESIKLDPSGYHKPGISEDAGFVSDRGSVTEYTGSETEVEIPSEIGEYDTSGVAFRAFYGNDRITKVVIPEGVTFIDNSAFLDCTALETVVLPDTLESIGPYAFSNCPNLKDVVLPENCSYVGFNAFKAAGTGSFKGSSAVYDYSCFRESGFESISIPAGSDITGDSMFRESQAEIIVLPEDMTAIGKDAFCLCEKLRFLDIPDTVTEFGEGCFSNLRCVNIKLPEGMEEIPDNFFPSTYLDVLNIPESVKKIGANAIFDANIVILNNPETELGEYAVRSSYLAIRDAMKFVFPDYEAISTDCLYLDGVYDPSDIQGSLKDQMVYEQLFLPPDVTTAECDTMDEYLLSLEKGDISWMGVPVDHLPEDTISYKLSDYQITSCDKEASELCVVYKASVEDSGFWSVQNVYSIADRAFEGASAKSVWMRGNTHDGVGENIFNGCSDLRDIWFSSQILYDADTDPGVCYGSDTFKGVPEDVTVHLPESMTDAERKIAQDYLRSCGMPEGAKYDFYNLRK